MAVAGATTKIIGDKQANDTGKQTEKMASLVRNNQIDENRRRATADYLQSTSDENAKMGQEHQSLAEKKNDNTQTLRAANASAEVAAAEGNVAGHNLDAIHSDYQHQLDVTNGRLSTNQEWADYQHTRNNQGQVNVFSNRAASIQPYQEAVQKPVDYFGPIFGAGAQAGNAAVATKSAGLW